VGDQQVHREQIDVSDVDLEGVVKDAITHIDEEATRLERDGIDPMKGHGRGPRWFEG
jgi:hypothetical protein